MERKEFLKLRHKRIGASEVGAIMGIDPFRSPYMIWAEKIKPNPPDSEPNWAMSKGLNLEPVARAKYELQTGKSFPPLMVENKDYSYMGCSLDGFNQEENKIIEIKYCGKNFIENILAEKPHYRAQVIYQMAMAGTIDANLLQINDAEEILSVPVPFDEVYAGEILSAVHKFWSLVIKRTPPPLSKKDTVIIKDKEWVTKFRKLNSLSVKMHKLDMQYCEIRDSIKLDKHGYECAGVKVVYVERDGAIDYKAIPELKNINLEQYRKKGTHYHKWSI